MKSTPSISLSLQIKIELFKRGCYDFITTRDGVKHEKQEIALTILRDNEHTEFLYGGGAGGAKSWTGATYLLFMALCYPETKWFIGREELKRIFQSTDITFRNVMKEYGITEDLYRFNSQYNYWEFYNGSRIDYLDLRYLPRDPMFERYGSIEYTGGWIEEGGEINIGAYDTLKTRVGRCKNELYGIVRKLFITCNPKKNWMYDLFYKPATKGELLDYRAYLPCLVQDNPFIDKGYIEGLQTTQDKVKKARLLDGDWEYDDNPNSLCSHDAILEMFGNKISERTGTNYLTGDIARFGADHARILVWDGWTVIDCKSFPVSKTTDIQEYILSARVKYRIPKYRCLVDDDGVGGGVVDNCDIIGFVNNSTPFNGENYQNLKVQCGYKLAEKINSNIVGIEEDVMSPSEKEEIIREVEQLQTWQSDGEGRLKLKPKEAIKEDIGGSPDWMDSLLMRSYFEYSDIDIPDDIENRLSSLGL